MGQKDKERQPQSRSHKSTASHRHPKNYPLQREVAEHSQPEQQKRKRSRERDRGNSKDRRKGHRSPSRSPKVTKQSNQELKLESTRERGCSRDKSLERSGGGNAHLRHGEKSAGERANGVERSGSHRHARRSKSRSPPPTEGRRSTAVKGSRKTHQISHLRSPSNSREDARSNSQSSGSESSRSSRLKQQRRKNQVHRSHRDSEHHSHNREHQRHKDRHRHKRASQSPSSHDSRNSHDERSRHRREKHHRHHHRHREHRHSPSPHTSRRQNAHGDVPPGGNGSAPGSSRQQQQSHPMPTTDEQKKMIRLAKARILANLQLQADEEEQQQQNQLAFQQAQQRTNATDVTQQEPTLVSNAQPGVSDICSGISPNEPKKDLDQFEKEQTNLTTERAQKWDKEASATANDKSSVPVTSKFQESQKSIDANEWYEPSDSPESLAIPKVGRFIVETEEKDPKSVNALQSEPLKQSGKFQDKLVKPSSRQQAVPALKSSSNQFEKSFQSQFTSKSKSKPLLFSFSTQKQQPAKNNVLLSGKQQLSDQNQTKNLQFWDKLAISKGGDEGAPIFIEEEDPLDTYMNSIQSEVVNQETFNIGADGAAEVSSSDQNAKKDEPDTLAIDNLINNCIDAEDIEMMLALDKEDEDINFERDAKIEKNGEHHNEEFTFDGKQEIEHDVTMEQDQSIQAQAQDEVPKVDSDIQLSHELGDQDEDTQFHSEFMRSLKQLNEVDTLRQQRGLNFDEEELAFPPLAGLSTLATSHQKPGPQNGKESKANVSTSQQVQEWEPFRKNLYIEATEIARMSERQVRQFRRESGDIKVRGLACARPILTWYQAGLPAAVLDVLQLKNFQKPFPIQCQALPAAMSGRDLIGIAETGSGKTLAYLLPLVRHIRDQRQLGQSEGPIGLIVAPTRELVQQIYRESRAVCRAVDLRAVAVYGGVNVQGQLSALKRGTEIVVCTPGRMRDVLAASNGRITNLRRVTYVVLDEADRMLDMGFEPQIRFMLALCRPDRQVLMFSATFPRSIEQLAKAHLRQPIEIVVGNRGQTCTAVEQRVELMHSEEEKLLKLIELLGKQFDSEQANDTSAATAHERGSVLVFVEKQAEADDLFKELFKIGYRALVLHGGMDQTDREFTIRDFRERVRDVLIATSVCARGLDIKHVALVVNFVCPNHLEDYVHRVGRTGRAGNRGTAITFISPEECSSAADLIRALESSQQGSSAVPEWLRELDDLYQRKLLDGECEKRRSNLGFLGKGHRFTRDEDDRIRTQRAELAKSFGMALEDANNADSDDEMLQQSAQQLALKQELDQLRHEHFQLVAMLERDPTAKKAAMEAGHRASVEAIKQGLSFEEATRLSREAMLFALQQYKPSVVSQERAMQQVFKIREHFVASDNQRNNIFTEEVEINDLPPPLRAKVQGRDFLQSTTELCGNSIRLSVKGNHVEGAVVGPGNGVVGAKSGAVGQKRLHILVEGASRLEAQGAAKEVKRIIEELLQSSMRGYSGFGGRAAVEFSGQFGKF